MLKKKAVRLLASSSSLAGAQGAVERFYGSPKTLVQMPDSDLWEIVSPVTGIVLEGIRVRHLRGRYRFEMTGDAA